MAVFASIISPYYKVLFDLAINLPDATYNTLTGVYKEAVDGQRGIYRYSVAKAIYTWIVAVPSITVILISLLNQFVDETTVNESTKISPEKSVPIESFGNKNDTMQNIKT